MQNYYKAKLEALSKPIDGCSEEERILIMERLIAAEQRLGDLTQYAEDMAK